MKFTLASLFALASLTLTVVSAAPLEKRGSSCYNGHKNNAKFTQYWIPMQGDTDMDNDGNILHLTGPANHALRTSNGGTIAKVDKNTFAKCTMEGTCYVHRPGNKEMILVNLANNGGSDPKFETLNKNQDPWGQGSQENPLDPFVSVAVNDLPRGTTLYVKELDGKAIPGGFTHNGCVRVDDDGWSFGGCQLDFFVLWYQNYVTLNLPEKISVSKKSCEVLTYTTASEYGKVGVKVPPNLPKGGNGGGVTLHHGSATKTTSSDSPKKTHSSSSGSSSSCDTSGTYLKSYTDTGLQGSMTCVSGSGCHNLNGVTKSSKWSSGTQITLYSGSDCSGESLYVDTIGEDDDVSGNGNGFHAGSVKIE